MVEARQMLMLEESPYEAVMSEDGRYRYVWRAKVSDAHGKVVFCLLNPSTASAQETDATATRGMLRTRLLGFGQTVIVNEFGYRATDPDALKQATDPVGPDNDYWLAREVSSANLVIVGWGAHGGYRNRDMVMRMLFDQLGIRAHALGFTKAGQPRHPLYMPMNRGLLEWK